MPDPQRFVLSIDSSYFELAQTKGGLFWQLLCSELAISGVYSDFCV